MHHAGQSRYALLRLEDAARGSVPRHPGAMRRVLLLVGLLAIAFGIGYLSYTEDKADQQWGVIIALLGVGCVVAGAAIFGFAFRRRRPSR